MGMFCDHYGALSKEDHRIACADIFRIDITVIDYKRGFDVDWELIREVARTLKLYTDSNDTLTTAILNYNGMFAGEVIYQVKHNNLVWYNTNSKHGKKVYNV